MWKAHRTCAWGACAPGRVYGNIQKERQADALPREKRKLVVIALQTRLRRTDTDMTKGSVLGRLVAFAVPLLIGNIFQQLYNTVDSVVVGNFVGKEALAAVGSVAPVVNMLIGFLTASRRARASSFRAITAHSRRKTSISPCRPPSP